MKILLITSEELNPKNIFSSCFELNLAKILKKRGYEVGILSFKSNPDLYRIIKNIILKLIFIKPKEYISIKDLIKHLINSFYYLFIKKVEHHFIDGINVFEGKLIIKLIKRNSNFIYRQYINLGIKTFRTYCDKVGRPDIIHAHSRFLNAPIVAEIIFKEHSIPYVITEHSSYYSTNILSNFEIELMKKSILNCKKFITVSKSLADLVSNQLKIDSSEWLTIPNVLSTAFQESQNQIIQKNDNKFIFLNVGSFIPIKNHSLLIKAFKEVINIYSNCELRIIGDGMLFENLKLLAKNLNILEKIVFMGHLNSSLVKNEMLNCHAFVLSSIYETFGVVLIEALACGKPVISTKCGGPNEIINDDNGLLVENESIKDLSSAMIYIKNNINKYDVDVIRNNCLKKYGENEIINKLLNIYNEAIITEDSTV